MFTQKLSAVDFLDGAHLFFYSEVGERSLCNGQNDLNFSDLNEATPSYLRPSVVRLHVFAFIRVHLRLLLLSRLRLAL